SFAVVGIYAGFQMVVMAALYARARGWVATGKFRLGAWAWPVNVLGLVWGVGAIADMLQPAGGDQPWFAAWGMALTFAAVIVSGLAYM
ncbi:amino acid permease, partial [Streptomyces scabiei]